MRRNSVGAVPTKLRSPLPRSSPREKTSRMNETPKVLMRREGVPVSVLELSQLHAKLHSLNSIAPTNNDAHHLGMHRQNVQQQPPLVSPPPLANDYTRRRSSSRHIPPNNSSQNTMVHPLSPPTSEARAMHHQDPKSVQQMLLQQSITDNPGSPSHSHTQMMVHPLSPSMKNAPYDPNAQPMSPHDSPLRPGRRRRSVLRDGPATSTPSLGEATEGLSWQDMDGLKDNESIVDMNRRLQREVS